MALWTVITEQDHLHSQPRAECGICWAELKNGMSLKKLSGSVGLSSGRLCREAGARTTHLPQSWAVHTWGKSSPQGTQKSRLGASPVPPWTENLEGGKREKSLTEQPSAVHCRALSSFAHVLAALKCSSTLVPGPVSSS